MPEKLPRFGRDEDSETEVTASVLLDRSQLGIATKTGQGIPAWLARSGPPSVAVVPPSTATPPTHGTHATSAGKQRVTATAPIAPAPAIASTGPSSVGAATLAPTPAPSPPPTTPPPAPAPPAPVPRPGGAAATMSSLPLGPPMTLESGPVPPPGPVSASGAIAPPGVVPPPVPSSAGPLGVRPPQPSWMAAGGMPAEARKPWEDTASFPRVVSSLSRPASPSTRRDVVELLWFDAPSTTRVRQRWQKLADDLEFAPLDQRHDLPSDDPQKARDRHTYFGILTEAPLSDAHELGAIVREAVNEQGRFTPPLVVVMGRLQFPFDELEILRATAAALSPLAGDDKKLKESLANVKELLDTPLLQHSNELIDNFVKHLRGVYDGSKRAVSRDYLDTSVERMLLEQRRYQKRSLFDGSWIRALLSPTTSGEAIPTYLPESLDKTLPMMVAFRARLVAEIHVKQDQYEAHPNALRVLAVGRVLDIPGY